MIRAMICSVSFRGFQNTQSETAMAALQAGAPGEVLRVLDIHRTWFASEGLPEGFLENIVDVFCMIDDADELHGLLEIAGLAGVLEVAAAHLLIETTLALAGDEDGGDVEAHRTHEHPRHDFVAVGDAD